MHRSVVDMSERMLVEMKRHNYVTPTNYLELVSGYKRWGLLDSKMHTHTHTHIHTNMHTHIYTYIHTMYMYMHTYILYLRTFYVQKIMRKISGLKFFVEMDDVWNFFPWDIAYAENILNIYFFIHYNTYDNILTVKTHQTIRHTYIHTYIHTHIHMYVLNDESLVSLPKLLQ